MLKRSENPALSRFKAGMIDGLVKNEKEIFLRECFVFRRFAIVFSVSARNKLITQRIFQPKTGYTQVKF